MSKAQESQIHGNVHLQGLDDWVLPFILRLRIYYFQKLEGLAYKYIF